MEILKDLEEKSLGTEVEGTWCDGLLYADDIVLFTRGWWVENVVEEGGRLMRRE